MPRFLRFWGPVVGYMGLIYWASSGPVPEALATTPDYFLHVPAYFVLSVLAVRALAKGLDSNLKVLDIAGGMAIAFLYGLSDEWHQAHVPGRDASLRDVISDSAGALAAGVALFYLWGGRER